MALQGPWGVCERDRASLGGKRKVEGQRQWQKQIRNSPLKLRDEVKFASNTRGTLSSSWPRYTYMYIYRIVYVMC